jgi:hypothetical protein
VKTLIFLSTVPWRHVSINVLLAILSGLVLVDVAAFLSLTYFIAFLDEIYP